MCVLKVTSFQPQLTAVNRFNRILIVYQTVTRYTFKFH